MSEPKKPELIELRTPDGRSPSQAVLDEVVRRVREIVEPQKIILFGSAARGTMSEHSDLDIMVIAETGKDRLKTAARISGYLHRGNGRRINFPMDVLLVSPETIRRYGDSLGLVYKPALAEGKVLYEA